MSATTCYAFQKLNKISTPCWRLSADCATAVNDMAREIQKERREREMERERMTGRAGYPDRNPFISGKFVGGMNPS